MQNFTILQRIGLGFIAPTALLLAVCALAWATLGGWATGSATSATRPRRPRR